MRDPQPGNPAGKQTRISQILEFLNTTVERIIWPSSAAVSLLAERAVVKFMLLSACIEFTGGWFVNKLKSTCLVVEAPALRCLGLPLFE